MIRVALTHDIDRTKKTYQYLTKPLRALFKGDYNALWNQFYSFFRTDNYWTFDEIIKIESGFNVKSTFFFLNETIKINYLKLKSYPLSLGRYNIKEPRISELIQWLDRNGWEIGVHGSYASYNNYDLLKKEKDTLEKIIGHDISAVRQHYLNLDANTWKLHQMAGFKYDSSLGFSDSTGSKDSIGFKNNQVFPFFPLNTGFMEIPLVLMDTNFMANKNNWKELESLIEKCETEGAVLVINFHNHVFNDKEFPDFKKVYIKLIETCKSRNASFYTLGEIYDIFINKKLQDVSKSNAL